MSKLEHNPIEEYKKWLKDADIPPMTNTQYLFAMRLFEKDSFELLKKFGDLDIIYNSVRKHLKP